jgi:hypothetical protein
MQNEQPVVRLADRCDRPIEIGALAKVHQPRQDLERRVYCSPAALSYCYRCIGGESSAR